MGKLAPRRIGSDEDSTRQEVAVHARERGSDGFAAGEGSGSGIYPCVPTYIVLPRWPAMPSSIDARFVRRAVELTKLTADYENSSQLQRVKVWLRQVIRNGEQLDDALLAAARSVFGPRLEGLAED